MTYQIALCDDETAELDKTEELLNIYEKKHPGTDFMIERFESAGELLCMVEEKSYAPDMIFMDIFMPGKDGVNTCLGMEAAKKLRDMGNRAKLFFLTTSKEYALEAFDVGRHHTVMVGDIFLDLLLKETCVPLVFQSQFNIFPAFGNILFTIQDSDMVSKT